MTFFLSLSLSGSISLSLPLLSLSPPSYPFPFLHPSSLQSGWARTTLQRIDEALCVESFVDFSQWSFRGVHHDRFMHKSHNMHVRRLFLPSLPVLSDLPVLPFLSRLSPRHFLVVHVRPLAVFGVLYFFFFSDRGLPATDLVATVHVSEAGRVGGRHWMAIGRRWRNSS